MILRRPLAEDERLDVWDELECPAVFVNGRWIHRELRKINSLAVEKSLLSILQDHDITALHYFMGVWSKEYPGSPLGMAFWDGGVYQELVITLAIQNGFKDGVDLLLKDCVAHGRSLQHIFSEEEGPLLAQLVSSLANHRMHSIIVCFNEVVWKEWEAYVMETIQEWVKEEDGLIQRRFNYGSFWKQLSTAGHAIMNVNERGLEVCLSHYTLEMFQQERPSWELILQQLAEQHGEYEIGNTIRYQLANHEKRLLVTQACCQAVSAESKQRGRL